MNKPKYELRVLDSNGNIGIMDVFKSDDLSYLYFKLVSLISNAEWYNDTYQIIEIESGTVWLNLKHLPG